MKPIIRLIPPVRCKGTLWATRIFMQPLWDLSSVEGLTPAAVDRQTPFYHRRPGEVFQYAAPAFPAHTRGPFRMVAQEFQFLAERLRIVGRHHESGDFVHYDLRHARHVGADGARGAGHAFEQRLAKQLRNPRDKTLG